MLKKGGRGSGIQAQGTGKWEQNPRIENIGFKLSFVSIFHFAVPRFLFSASLSAFSNILVFPFAGYAYEV